MPIRRAKDKDAEMAAATVKEEAAAGAV